MELEKKDIRLSGVYGKIIMKSFPYFEYIEKNKSILFKGNGITLTYHLKNHNILVSGFGENGDKYKELLTTKINNYLLGYANNIRNPFARAYMKDSLNNQISIDSSYHIFNVELTYACIQSEKLIRLEYLRKLMTDSYQLNNSIDSPNPYEYEKLLLALVYLESDYNAKILYDGLMSDRGCAKRDFHYKMVNEWLNPNVDSYAQIKVEEGIQKIKIDDFKKNI